MAPRGAIFLSEATGGESCFPREPVRPRGKLCSARGDSLKSIPPCTTRCPAATTDNLKYMYLTNLNQKVDATVSAFL
jgi:hypothetical protein